MKSVPREFVRRLCRRLLSHPGAILAGCLSAAVAVAQTPTGNGSIHGQVSNVATGATLRGVHVHVAETNQDVFTGQDGTYEIIGLAPRMYSLMFDYPGLDRQEVKVSVPEGGAVRQDMSLTAAIYRLEKFVVAGEREGNAAAIAAEKNAVAVTNVVASDAFGNIAKGNVGNFLRRIPGITGTTDEADTDNIQLRGMSEAFTAIDIDGVKYATSNTGRGQSVQGIPTEMIERIEVVKAPTPDTDSDSIAGRINMVTKSAFDRNGRLLTVRAANTYSFTYGKDVGGGRTSRLFPNWMSPSFAVNYGDVFSIRGGHNNLGIMATGNWERVYDVRGTTSWDSFSTVSGRSLPQFNNVSVALHGIERGGLLLRGDYKVSRDFSYGVQASYNDSTNSLLRARNQLMGGSIRASSLGLLATVVDGAQYAIERGTRDNEENRTAVHLWGKYDSRATGWKLNAETTFQRTRGNNFTDQITVRSNQRINYVLDRRIDAGADMRWPTIHVFTPRYTGSSSNTTAFPTTFVEGYNPFGDDFSNASQTAGQWQQIFAKRETLNARLDGTKGFAWRWPIELKSGFALKYEKLDQSRHDLRGTLNSATTGFGPDFRSVLDPDWHLGGAIGRYPVGYMIDMAKLQNAGGISFKGPNADPALEWNYDPTKFTISTDSTRQNTLQNNRQIWERTGAAYVQASAKFGRFDMTTGVRGEETEVTRNQILRNRPPTGQPSTLAEWTSRIYGSTTYTKFYPSVHGRLYLTPNLQLRGSYGITSGKPDFGRILGVTDVNDNTNTINVPNLELRPRISRNADLAVSYYFEPVGEFTVGIFQKKISDYDSNVTRNVSLAEAADLGAPVQPGDQWQVTTRENVGDGRIRGLELNYTQQFSKILPGAWKGLGFYSNFTVLSIEGTFDVNDAGTTTPIKVNQLEEVIRRTANAGLSYNYNRYDLRLSYNFTDYFPESSSTNLSTVKIRGSRWTIDASAKYKVTRRMTLFADLVNITSNHGAKYRGYVDQNLRNETNALGFIGTAGVLLSF